MSESANMAQGDAPHLHVTTSCVSDPPAVVKYGNSWKEKYRKEGFFNPLPQRRRHV